jgi:hypothetical protein
MHATRLFLATDFPGSPAITTVGGVVPVLTFDFLVEPARTYRYRARQMIWDARGRTKEIAGTWSEPTAPVTVPRGQVGDRSIRGVRSLVGMRGVS